MKKLLLSIVLLGAIIWLLFTTLSKSNQVTQPNELPQITSEVSLTPGEETTFSITEATTDQVTTTEQPSLFHETLGENAQYPVATTPAELTDVDLFTAMNDYYQANYTTEEQQANQAIFTEQAINSLQSSLNTLNILPQMTIDVDVVTMTLNNATTYIPRIIIPTTYQNAQSITPENDIKILNETLTQIGNRLIMITYYDANNDSLMVYHLTNWTKPLFTYATQ